jgi:hypothetical protein
MLPTGHIKVSAPPLKCVNGLKSAGGTYVIARGFLPRVRVEPGATISKANMRLSVSWKRTDI